MDYIRQHTKAFQRAKKSGLGAHEWLVYSEIFSRANATWNLAGEVEISAVELMQGCNIKNNDTLRNYRKKLIDAGMIEYRPGSGRGSKGIYKLVDLTGGVKGHLKGTLKAAEQAPAAAAAPVVETTPEPEQGVLLAEPEPAPAPAEPKPKRVRKKAEPPKMRAYGLYQNVMLSDFQYSKLLEMHGEAVVMDYIEKVGSYVYTNPAKAYRDYLKAINNWIKHDKARGTFHVPAPAPAALPAATETERAAAAAIENAEDDIFKRAREARLHDWQQ